jgi:uncharacterized phage protein gp47/JayE
MAVDATGLTIKTSEQISADIATAQRDTIDPALVTSPEEPQGQLNGIYADSERQVWEAVAIAYNAFNPDAAEGFLLDALCALTGTVRLVAKPSRVLCSCTLTTGTILLHDTHAAHVADHPEWRFVPEVDFTAPDDDDYDVWFESEELGPIPANAGLLTVIATPITGWTAVTNALDATLGTNEEQDDALRIRREERLQAQGSATLGAIRSAVLAVDGVINCDVYENATDSVDANGLPGHSFEVVVFDGETPAADDDEIAQAIQDNRAAGVQAFGFTSGESDEGTIAFTRPTAMPIYIVIGPVGTVDSDVLKAAIVTGMQAINRPGTDVVRNEIIVAAMGVAGVTDIESCTLGFTPAPMGDTNLPIGIREIADYDTSRISVV